MKLVMMIALAAGGIGAAVAQQAPKELTRPAPVLQRIEMETTTWGREIRSWSIDAAGNVRQTRAEPDAFKVERMVTRSYAAGTAGFRKIRLQMALAEAEANATPNGRQLPCTQAITDAVYGNAAWVTPNGRAMKLAFYTACTERTAQNVIAALREADEQIATWADAGQIVETRIVERPQ